MSELKECPVLRDVPALEVNLSVVCVCENCPNRAPSPDEARLREALEIMEFLEGSEKPAHGGAGAQPVIKVNAEDFMTVLTAVRAALGKDGEA